MIPALEYHPDGDFYIAKQCRRCEGLYYVYALQNRAWTTPVHDVCDWCRGECSASDQERRNESALSYVPQRRIVTRTCEDPAKPKFVVKRYQV